MVRRAVRSAALPLIVAALCLFYGGQLSALTQATPGDLVSGVAWRIARPVLLSLPVIALLLGISVSRSLAPISAL